MHTSAIEVASLVLSSNAVASIRTVTSGLAEEFSTAVDTALQKDVHLRFHTAKQLAAQLSCGLHTHQIQLGPAPATGKHESADCKTHALPRNKDAKCIQNQNSKHEYSTPSVGTATQNANIPPPLPSWATGRPGATDVSTAMMTSTYCHPKIHETVEGTISAHEMREQQQQKPDKCSADLHNAKANGPAEASDSWAAGWRAKAAQRSDARESQLQQQLEEEEDKCSADLHNAKASGPAEASVGPPSTTEALGLLEHLQSVDDARALCAEAGLLIPESNNISSAAGLRSSQEDELQRLISALRDHYAMELVAEQTRVDQLHRRDQIAELIHEGPRSGGTVIYRSKSAFAGTQRHGQNGTFDEDEDDAFTIAQDTKASRRQLFTESLSDEFKDILGGGTVSFRGPGGLGQFGDKVRQTTDICRELFVVSESALCAPLLD
eukprot:SAG31_NODE_1153_length_9640_cov_2.830206_8_plen_437_part_00